MKSNPFKTSFLSAMTFIGNIFDRLYKKKPLENTEVKVLTQATKLEAAHASIHTHVIDDTYRMNFVQVDRTVVESIATNLPELNEYLGWYVNLLSSGEGIRHTDIRGKATTVTLSDFLTADGYYVSPAQVQEFYRLASMLVDSLIEFKDSQTGRQNHHIRMLGNAFVTIKNINDAFAKCSMAAIPKSV